MPVFFGASDLYLDLVSRFLLVIKTSFKILQGVITALDLIKLVRGNSIFISWF